VRAALSWGDMMTADEYRRQGFLAQQRARTATDPVVKAGREQLAQEWMALADQAALLEKRYGPLAASDLAQSRPRPVALQQQQVQSQQKEDC
jgi:hypothetical protein